MRAIRRIAPLCLSLLFGVSGCAQAPVSTSQPSPHSTARAQTHPPLSVRPATPDTATPAPIVPGPIQTPGTSPLGEPGLGCAPLISLSALDGDGKPLAPNLSIKGYLTVTSSLSCAEGVRSVQYLYRLLPIGEFTPLGALQTPEDNYREEINTSSSLVDGDYELISKVILNDGSIRLSAPLTIRVDNSSAGGSSKGGGGGGGGGGGSNPNPSASPSPSPSSSASPGPDPSPSASGVPSPDPSPTASAEPSPSPSISPTPAPTPTPAPGNVVFAVSPSFGVPAGTQKWSLNLGEQVSSTPLVTSSGASYFAADNKLYAYDASGRQTASLPLANEVTAAAALSATGQMYFGDGGGNLVRVDTQQLGNGPTYIPIAAGQPFEYNAPAIDPCSGDVYIQSRDRRLFRIASGSSTATQIGTAAAYPDATTTAARYASPVVTATHIITGSQQGLKIIAKSNLPNASTPAPTFLPGTSCTATGCSSSVTALDKAINSPVAVAGDGSIFAVSETGTLFKIDPSGTPSQVWARFVGDSDAGPVIGSDGTVYVASENGVLKAFDPTTGATRFELGLGNVVEFSTPAIGKGPNNTDIIYVGTESGTLYAFNGYNAPGAGTERFRKELGAPIRSSIAIANDGTVFAGTLDGRLYTIYGDSLGLQTSGQAWPKAQGNAQGSGVRPGGIGCG